ncbi:ionotropic receptor 21a [Lutzomyia longipalpis]|uniref:ionotropic receptor 21a n=1 Tax=Lutzomyia longipalpis TaxID=7200 RepID=UPI002483E7C6|nr:ionotropic receptor 21a [Lutzomyia longipalpis]
MNVKISVVLTLCAFLTTTVSLLEEEECPRVLDYLQNATTNNLIKKSVQKRFVDPTFRGNPKTREEVWHSNFNTTSSSFDQTPSLIILLNKITTQYLNSCIPVILYDKFVQNSDSVILQKLFQTFPMSYIHGRITQNYTVEKPELLQVATDSKCRSYILFLADAMMTRKVLGPQIRARVVVIPRTTQWKLQEFLSSPLSRDIVNLLVIGESYSSAEVSKKRPFVLYTHKLYADGLGANKPIVLTSWINDRLSRPHVNLFPPKFLKGFSGHRFLVAAAHQPPFVFKKKSTDGVGNVNIAWEGLELRLLNILKTKLNFTYEIMEPHNQKLSSGDGVVQEVALGTADIGAGGAYVTTQRIADVEMTVGHSRDCAAYVTLMSKALPRYRAILGPFQYPVWIALTFTYLVAIFPLAFSDRLTLSHLYGNAGEVENMFWYVFGTFTNCFTFIGKYSWSTSKKDSTRMLIGWYWVFTIIITSCYTGSIIAFVTLPIFPATVDSIDQLLSGFYRFGTLEKGGWEYWFANSTHKDTARLIKDLEFVRDIPEGINNVTKAFFWSYAFLGSQRELEYVVQSNYTDETLGKRSALHISDDCFGLFYSAFAMPKDSVYTDPINEAILRMQQSGLIDKLSNEVSWAMQRTPAGRLLQVIPGKVAAVAVEERGLTLADTEGMFLLLGMGFVLALAALVSEWVGGCTKKCKSILLKRRRRAEGLPSEEVSETTSYHPNSIQPDHQANSEFHLSGIASQSEREIGREGSEKTPRKAMSLKSLNQHTLKELFDGPKRRHSTVILMDGQMMTDAEALEKLQQKHEEADSINIFRLFGYLDKEIQEMEKPALNGGSLDAEIIHEVHEVEINRPATPFSCEKIDEAFGEKVTHP